MQKRYLPVIYVDEDGEMHEKKELTEKIYKKLKTTTCVTYENDKIYIHTTNLIKITIQKNLFQ